MSKRIGIMTFHRALNYGALLQSFALMHILNENNFRAELIDYHCRGIDDVYRPFHANECNGIPDKTKKLLKSFQLIKKRRSFEQFSAEFLKRSDPIYKKQELVDVSMNYDIVISGSDQVFDPDITLGDLSYFLDFVPDAKKKIAYAGCFGKMTAHSKKSKEVGQLLSRFDDITLREQSGVTLLEKLCAKTAQSVLDPTLLLTGEEWGRIAKPPKSLPKKYVLCYVMWGCNCALDEARRLAKEIDAKVVLLNPTLKQQLMCRDCVQYTSASPQEFLYLFKNAEKVVTTSFHGTAFSIIFEKDFYAEIISKGSETRFTDLLEPIGLSDRILPQANGRPIDWENVRKKIGENRTQSIKKLLAMCDD